MRIVTVTSAVVLCLFATAAGEIPQVVGYQGRITENTGVPVANGTYLMRFKIYDAETGGTLLWDSGDDSVATNSGVFSVMLGESPHPVLSLDFDQDYWLLVTFRAEDQLPRRRLGSIGYAYMASGLVPGTEVIGEVTTGTLAAIAATNTATGGGEMGLSGVSSSSYGWGVFGQSPHGGVGGRATATSGFHHGVWGASQSPDGVGLYGWAEATTGSSQGVHGRSSSSNGSGVYGWAEATAGATAGVFGRSESRFGRGVYGVASATTDTTYGVYGKVESPDGYALYGENPAGWAGGFAGDVHVAGNALVDSGIVAKNLAVGPDADFSCPAYFSDLSVTPSTDFLGLYNWYRRTGGTADENNSIQGLFSEIGLAAGTSGLTYGMHSAVKVSGGQVGTDLTNQDVAGIHTHTRIYPGVDVNGNVKGLSAYTRLRGGGTIDGDMCSLYLRSEDEGGTIGGNSYMIYLYEEAGVDYGIYQNGGADNRFGGNVGIGVADPARKLHVSDVMRLEPRANPPGGAGMGDMYVDSDDGKLYVHDGSTWQACW